MEERSSDAPAIVKKAMDAGQAEVPERGAELATGVAHVLDDPPRRNHHDERLELDPPTQLDDERAGHEHEEVRPPPDEVHVERDVGSDERGDERARRCWLHA